MNTVWDRRLVASTLLSLVFAVTAVTGTALGSTLVDPTFDVLRTRTGTYTNVTVTTRADKYIFIQHSCGLSSIRVADLPPDVLQELGYTAPREAAPKRGKHIAQATARELTSQVNQNLKPFEDALKQQWQVKAPLFHLGSEMLLTLLVIVAVLYLFFCYILNLICLNARSPRSFLIWVPVLQFLPLFRAAGMSGWWTLACFVPLLNLVAHILWSVNIVKACGKNFIWTVLLVLPFTNLIALLYLAFSKNGSSEAASPKPDSKFQTRSLQTA